MYIWTPLIALLVAGCVRTVEGPDLGECADYPDGTYTYGEIGIGTCLSTPADIQFIEQAGRTWLAVSNADAYVNFGESSLLLIDWDSVDLTRRYNRMHELEAYAQPTLRFNGEFGWIPERELAVVTNRFSEGAATRSHNDRVFVVDLSDPTQPQPWETRPVIPLQDDPYLVEVDPEEEVVYVANITDHTISLLSTTSSRLFQIPVSPKTEVSEATFVDPDGSGSLATLDSIVVLSEQFASPDLWTLTYVDKLVRLWAPTPNDDGDLGLVRWTSGDVDFDPSGFGLELDPADSPAISGVVDPMVVAEPTGVVSLFYVDGGSIRNLIATVAIADWQPGPTAPYSGTGGWDAILGGPAISAISPTLVGLYHHGRPSEDAAASIGLAVSDDGLGFAPSGNQPLITDPAGLISYEHPFVRADAITHNFRMWMSVWDGEQWSIGLTESVDGLAWDPVETVLSIPGGHAAAPVVTYINGRYLMWLTVDDGIGWSHATAWSYDGHTWFDLIEVVPSDVPFDLAQPPRPAVQADTTGAWRMEGRDQGTIAALVVAGTQFVSTTRALSLSLASGHEVDNNQLIPANRAANGLIPGSLATVAGDELLYVTLIGLDERQRIGVIRRLGESWAFLGSDLIPAGTGGNVAGVSDPVVVPHDGGYMMFYAATNDDGVTLIRRATSDDGRSFTPVPGPVVDSGEDWDGVTQLPHSVEPLANGRIRLWYAGFDGNRFRIGAATAADPGASFSPDPGPVNPWQLGPGVLGSFDDTGVKDPMVFTDDDGTTRMYYSGFDGERWHIGHAVRQNGTWIRRTEPGADESVPSMSPQPASFSVRGVEHPVLGIDDDGEQVLWYAGTDGAVQRLGRAQPRGEVVFATQRFPTPGDFLQFQVTPGGPEWENIRLAQSTAEFQTTGVGMSSMTLDPDRGFLYVTSKLANFVYVIDVRDDTNGVFDDANYRDIETLIRVQMQDSPLGFRDALVDTLRDRLYLTAREPDGVVVIDLNEVEDTDTKTVTHQAAAAVFPLRSLREDEGARTLAEIGGNGMAITPDNRLLLVTHLRGNALYVFDLQLGAYGEQIAYLPHIGENPHMVRISPDGRHAVVANYLGEVTDDNEVSSTLAVVDLDPESPTYLEIITWIANR